MLCTRESRTGIIIRTTLRIQLCWLTIIFLMPSTLFNILQPHTMAKHILTISLIFLCSFSLGQNTQLDLSKIITVSQAEAYISANPKSESKLFTIESSIDTTEIDKSLYNKKVGFTFTIGNLTFKILHIDSTLSFRANYIYLDGSQFSKTQIDSLRQEIIFRFQEGTNFFNLVQQYNMDGNFNGDTKWFTENMMVKSFEEAVKAHKKNDIFTVDIPEQSWYYVVLKSYDNTFIKKVILLKTKRGS